MPTLVHVTTTAHLRTGEVRSHTEHVDEQEAYRLIAWHATLLHEVTRWDGEFLFDADRVIIEVR